jgi:AraC family transcriptional regulator of adaptative response / DNA-3-methyladenine glycosylase II
MTTHDARFDGRFYVAVSSTMIYCRPVCRVKLPKRENCTFYPSAAAAEASGFRPCLRCRPELAPGNAAIDAGERIAHSAARLIEDGALIDSDLEALANRLGVTARHLRRTFQSQFGVSPVEFAQTHRLLLAKRLLTDTSLSVTDVAFTSGFGSLSRFDALFKKRYRLSPKQLRKTAPRHPQRDTMSFELSYRPPYDWASLVAFLGARSITGVEVAVDSAYRRIVRIAQAKRIHTGWVEIKPDPRRNVMYVVISASLTPVIPAVLARAKHLLDISCDPVAITEVLGAIAVAKPGLRVPGAFDGFEVAVRAVLGQQVSVAAARTLAGRIAAAFGTAVETPFEELNTSFPSAADVAKLEVEQIAALGVLPSRSRTILELAKAIAAGDIALTPGVNVAATMDSLKCIGGIGEWTAQYIAMRALAWPDAYPHTDLGVMKALGESSPKRVLEAGEAWRPWRAYAVMHLWNRGASSNGTIR